MFKWLVSQNTWNFVCKWVIYHNNIQSSFDHLENTKLAYKIEIWFWEKLKITESKFVIACKNRLSIDKSVWNINYSWSIRWIVVTYRYALIRHSTSIWHWCHSSVYCWERNAKAWTKMSPKIKTIYFRWNFKTFSLKLKQQENSNVFNLLAQSTGCVYTAQSWCWHTHWPTALSLSSWRNKLNCRDRIITPSRKIVRCAQIANNIRFSSTWACARPPVT